MKKKITLPLVAIIGIFLSGCGTPIIKENPHSSDQEAKADRQYRGAQKFQND